MSTEAEVAADTRRLSIPDLLAPQKLFLLVIFGLLLGLLGWTLSVEMTWLDFLYPTLFALWSVLLFSIVIRGLNGIFARSSLHVSMAIFFLVVV